MSWGIPLVIATVVCGLVIWRTIVGRDEPAPAPVASAPSGEASADPAPSLPLAPRCVELSSQPFMIGEASSPRPAPPPSLEAGAPVEAADELEDDLTPFAVEIGRGTVFAGGFAAGARRDAEGGAVAMVATLGIDGTGGKLIKLGRSRGDLDPPVVAGIGDVVLAALLEPNAGGRSIRIAKVQGEAVTWGLELSEGRDESSAIDLAASGSRAVVVWDDVNVEEKRSHVMLSSFDVATMRSVTSARPVSAPKTDADSPRLIARPGGYWLGYLARANEGAKTKKDPSNAGEKAAKKGDDDGDDESGEAIQNGWIEVMPLDENGAPTAAARAAPPAPSTATRAPSIVPAPAIARVRPRPSVLSPTSASPSRRTQFTAPIAAAAGVSRSASAAASSLNGLVMFSPAKPRVRAAAQASANPSRGTAIET